MPRTITITFDDGSNHTYQNAPDNLTPQDVQARAEKDFGKVVTGIDGGKKQGQNAANVLDRNAYMSAVDKRKTEGPGFFERGGTLQNVFSGIGAGAGSIGATLATPVDLLLGNTESIANPERRQRLKDAYSAMGADTNSTSYGAGKIAGEVAGTAGAGGLVAKGLSSVPAIASKAPALIEALRTGGMSAGGLTGGAGVATRAAGGAIGGGLSAGMVSPEDYGTGAAFGAATPGVLQLAGKLGSTVYNAVKQGKANSGQLLADALGVTKDELPAIIAKLNAAPDSIVDGSKLTLAQALQKQGAKIPSAALLERVVAEGPGGNALLTRYADQQGARMNALGREGAETYQGATADIKNRAGSKLAAILRTQAGDDQAAAKALWERTYGQAAKDNVMLNLPLDDMRGAMSPLGRGTVGAGKDAQAILNEAQNIGTYELPAIQGITQKAAGKSQSLEQAVRAAGGIRGGAGELRDLGIKQSGTTGLVNNKTGKAADMLAEDMYRRGFLPDSDPATLFDALRNGGGRSLFANDATEGGMQRMAESAMGDAPTAERIAQAIPFEEFQRLRRSAGALGAKVGERAGGETEAGVLNKLSQLLTQRADDAANGMAMSGDNISPEFLQLYNQARGATKQNAELYKGGSNIAQILRKPVGQDYTLGGDEVVNKLWHGGSGLVDDVSRLKNTLSSNNYEPSMNELRKFIMTEAAGKTTASGALGAALPKYVEGRLPALEQAMTPSQLKALTSVAADIRNAESAANVAGMRGSDSMAKISRALDAGILDSPIAKLLTQLPGVRQLGGNAGREKLAQMLIESKANQIAGLLADPKLAANALKDAAFVKTLDPITYRRLLAVSRTAPVLSTQMLQE